MALIVYCGGGAHCLLWRRQLVETALTDANRLLVFADGRTLRAALVAEDLSAVAAVVFPRYQRELLATSRAVGHVRVLGPLATRVLLQLQLSKHNTTRVIIITTALTLP